MTRCRTVGPERQTFHGLKPKTRWPGRASVSADPAVAAPARLSPLPCRPLPVSVLQRFPRRHSTVSVAGISHVALLHPGTTHVPPGRVHTRAMQPSPDSAIPPAFEAPFDNELGLVFTELTPDAHGHNSRFSPSCCSRWASCMAVSTARWSRAWPASPRRAGSARTAAVPSSASTTTPTSCARSAAARCTAPRRRCIAAVVSNCGWSPSPIRRSGGGPRSGAAAEPGRSAGRALAGCFRRLTLHAPRQPVPPTVRVGCGRTPAAR